MVIICNQFNKRMMAGIFSVEVLIPTSLVTKLKTIKVVLELTVIIGW